MIFSLSYSTVYLIKVTNSLKVTKKKIDMDMNVVRDIISTK